MQGLAHNPNVFAHPLPCQLCPAGPKGLVQHQFPVAVFRPINGGLAQYLLACGHIRSY